MPKKTLKKTTKKKSAPRRKKKTRGVPEAPLMTTQELVSLVSSLSPETPAPRGAAKPVPILGTTSPPVSPYLIRLAKELPREPDIEPRQSRAIAPTLAEELERARALEGVTTEYQIDTEPTIPPKPSRASARSSGILFGSKFSLPKLPSITLPTFSIHIPKPKLGIRLAPFRLPALIRSGLSFALVGTLFLLPATGLSAFSKFENAKLGLTARGEAIFQSLESISRNPETAPEVLASVNQQFVAAKVELDKTVGVLDSILPLIPMAGNTYGASSRLLDAAGHLTEAGRITGEGFRALADSPPPLTNRLIHFEESLRAAFPLIRAAEIELNEVKAEAVPGELETVTRSLKTAVRDVSKTFEATIKLLPALEEFLGASRTNRYLVVFQNPNELRATGGFIGSYALVDIDRGAVKTLEIPGGGSYDLACCLTERVSAPQPLHLIEPRWQFHDANWFPDFPTSAKKLIWFYEKSGGPSVDGVIAVNASLLPYLLNTLGPITIPEFNRTFTAENVIAETQAIVEFEYDRAENKPKKLIGLLAPKLLDRVMAASPETLLDVLGIFADALDTKEIQIFTRDAEVQETFSELGWTGELSETSSDYLLVTASNIAGGKTSGVIQTDIEHLARINEDGTVTNSLKITRTHHGKKGDQFTGVRNVEYLRIYVPLASVLTIAEGFEAPPSELFDRSGDSLTADQDLLAASSNTSLDRASGTLVYEEAGKTVFGNWSQVDPGESVTIHLFYQLPWKLRFDNPSLTQRIGTFLGMPQFASYSLLVENQSGLTASLKTTTEFPPSFPLEWHHRGEVTNGQVSDSFKLDRAKWNGLLFKR